ncbi:unnamed protein product [Peniophora sp. CBMAI 1063]|nr:unnamed protein product [Peniophora sp. CBMAI 1063]
MPSLALSDASTGSSSDNAPETPDHSQVLATPIARPDYKGKAPLRPRVSKPLPAPPVPTETRQRAWSTFMRVEMRVSLPGVLQTPGVLKNMLHFLSWHDFRAVARSSKACRTLVRKPELGHIILSRFVPSYRYCLEHADTSSPSFRNVPFAFRDLDLFMTSQNIPLHKYPRHALSVLSALWPTEQHNRKTESCMELCLSHSRTVLLLQSLIHSSQAHIADDFEDFSFRPRATPSPRAVRELVFPAPLAYFSAPASAASSETNSLAPSVGKNSTKGAKRRASKIFSRSESRSKRTVASLDIPRAPPTRPSASSRPASIFGTFTSSGVRVPPPLPSEDTLGLRIYAESWRSHRRQQRQSVSASSSLSDGESLFRRPQRRFASSSLTRSSASSIDESQSPSPSRTRITQSRTLPTVSSPHDIRLATSRLRAPVLRVFHPCTELDDAALTACETQLVDSGLWAHLSTGDLVCNLGYLPPETTETEDVVTGSESGSAGSSSVGSTESRDGLWLLFDGTELVPWDPTTPLPLGDPLSLPSPLYYAHVLPAGTPSRLTLALPRAEPQFALQRLTLDVPSPNSPRGIARTHRFAWLATLPPAHRENLGEGWQGEWVLEGEGTPEGRARLLDAVSGAINRAQEWEMVPEKTTASRLWLRLVS